MQTLTQKDTAEYSFNPQLPLQIFLPALSNPPVKTALPVHGSGLRLTLSDTGKTYTLFVFAQTVENVEVPLAHEPWNIDSDVH